ncbi:hypothetical protein HDU98_003146 [Podochytrium sp. JEL0797]|nr:hypothetical protein HDU98_003146 [Podochytrium sp. JEL0797]
MKGSTVNRSPKASPLVAPISSAIAVRTNSTPNQPDEDVVFIVASTPPRALRGVNGNSPRGLVFSSPLVNGSAWYQSPHGFQAVDGILDDDAIPEMEELVLDTNVASAVETQVTDVQASLVESERITFAKMSSMESSLLKPAINVVAKVPCASADQNGSSSGFKWKVPPIFQGFRGGLGKVTSVSTPSPKSSPLAFLALASEETQSSHDKKKKYRFVKRLGQGVQGVVTLSVHTSTGAKVALKTISIFSRIDPNVRASFRREVALLQEAHAHPNVLRLMDFWEGKSKVYQAFEYCSGGDLTNGLGAVSPMDEESGAHLMAPTVSAVAYLHGLGILHRVSWIKCSSLQMKLMAFSKKDIRPANVLLRRPILGTEQPEELKTYAVLADFGISCHSSTTGRLGTAFAFPPPHIAPEVVAGERFTKSSDVFGLGVCLITVLLGRSIEISDQNPKLVPREAAWTVLSASGKKFLRRVLEQDPGQRISAGDALEDGWFKACGVHM